MTSETTFNTLDPRTQAQIIADLMDLFKSNSRGYGLGEFVGAKFNEDKNKWIPGNVRWVWGETTAQQWRDHLCGTRLLGQGVLCDDGKVHYACLDVDLYEIDYAEAMQKITHSSLPLVVFRTKSGGLRICVFFSEGIEADLVRPRMSRVASMLGFSGCEIFPKQTKLIVEQGDCPSWIFMCFGGTHDMFAEQGCMNANGHLMDIVEAVAYCKRRRITRAQFLELFKEDDAARNTAKANGKRHQRGLWVAEESYEVTRNTMFHDGPPCMWEIARNKCTGMQNNFLLDVSTFLKKKYPENWDKALEWVNYNILHPGGDRDRLNDIVKRVRNHEYEYKCRDEPICSHCNPHACRRMPYGVGAGGGRVDFHEMGMTIVERIPRIFMISFGDVRMDCEAGELLSQQRFKEKCLSYGVPAPPTMKREEWEQLVNANIENATKVEPTEAMRTGGYEIGLLKGWLSPRISSYMRIGKDDDNDVCRLVEAERRVYFKWNAKNAAFSDFIRRNYMNEYGRMAKFITTTMFMHHKQGEGIRGWFRGTYSISVDAFDEDTVEAWLKEKINGPQEPD